MSTSIASPKTIKRELPLRITVNKPINQIKAHGLLICGILSSVLYVAMNIFIPMQYSGYSSASQTVSELSAVDAPTRPLWVSLGIVYALLVVTFGWGIWKFSDRNRALRIVAGLILAYGVICLIWPFAPMHQREVLATTGGTLTDTIHIVLAITTVLLMVAAIGLGATAFGDRFGFYSIATIVILFVFGALTGVDGPWIEANLPTPWVGIWERINIGVFLLWIVMLAIILLRREKRPHSFDVKDAFTLN